MYKKLTDGSNVFIGNKTIATYTPSEEAMYKYNAFIEGLRVFSIEQICKLISRKPAYSELDRLKLPEQRLLLVQTISDYIEPTPNIIDFVNRLMRVIRNGYSARNPISAEWVKQVRAGFPELDWGEEISGYKPIIRSNASGFALIGTSGVGKTTAVESGLGLNPQVIIHSEYNGHIFNRVQLVWLKLECPQDGSLKGLCLNFFQAIDVILDTRYYEKFGNSRRTVDELLPNMSKLAANVGLGVLIIDEIQRLNDAKSGGAKRMLNFFVQLVNTIGVPVILVGTFKALHLLNNEFAMARRSAGQGDFFWFNERQDEFWDHFIESLWRFQWTNIISPLTPKIKGVIYDESQGIVDIAVKLYQLAQWDVIGSGDERITPELIRKVAKESLQIAKPLLEALKMRDTKKLQEIGDIEPPIENLNEYYKRASERVTTTGVFNTIRNQQVGSEDSIFDDESPKFRIAKWLVEAGFEPATARESAEEAIGRFSADYDLKRAMKMAYEIASVPKKVQPKEIKPTPKFSGVFSNEDMRGIVQKGNLEGKNGYESLKNTGLIKPASEFL